MIVPLTAAPDRLNAVADIETIFFRSTLRTRFASAEERAAFFETWAGWYLRHAPEDTLLWLEPDGRCAGYLTGCRDSAGAAGLFATIPRYDAFADLFVRFPAHLHINVHPDRRDRGIGATLIKAFAEACGTGVHIVTGINARNAAFYRRNGFTHAVERAPLLLLGRDAR